ncbi:MAG TPA: GGDEF domain-containing protein [Streptosporangiaceae bacterium]
MTTVHSSAATAGDGLPHPLARRAALPSRPFLACYFTAVAGLHLGLAVTAVLTTVPRLAELLTFCALMACGAVCIEASRRLGVPAGVARDLLSAWWLPVALLLPPAYALIMPIPLQALLQVRVRQTLPYRRLMATSALGLAGASASYAFHSFVPGRLTGAHAWLTGSGTAVGAAVACAALFTVVNAALIAIAAHGAAPDCRWREVLWTRENLLLDVVELCVGVLVTVACALSPALLVLALPPVVLLQRSLLHQQLQAAARTDGKTGLLNAAAWQREADTELSRAQRSGDPLALLLVDLDHFKQVNDTYGHLVGDQVLIGVAGTLCSQLRDYDIIGRFGGEEFVVLVPGADTVEACRVAERLRSRARRLAVPADDGSVAVTISIGVALLHAHGEDLIELLAAADLALYRAKESGRDRVCLPAAKRPAASIPPPDRA